MKQKLIFSFSLLFFIFSIPLFISLKELNKADLKFELPEGKWEKRLDSYRLRILDFSM